MQEVNQAATTLARNHVDHARTKHKDICYYFIREGIQNGSIHLKYVTANKMVADILTKPLPKHRFEKLLHSFGKETVKC